MCSGVGQKDEATGSDWQENLISTNVPALAARAAGECFIFIQNALDVMRDAGANVLLEVWFGQCEVVWGCGSAVALPM